MTTQNQSAESELLKILQNVGKENGIERSQNEEGNWLYKIVPDSIYYAQIHRYALELCRTGQSGFRKIVGVTFLFYERGIYIYMEVANG